MTANVTTIHKPMIMGVINVTPDSFSDGSMYQDPDQAYRHGMKMLEAGADILDIGGESTRPGSSEVAAEAEWQRIHPVLKKFRAANLTTHISVDTRKPELMRLACEYEIAFINNVDGRLDHPVLEFMASQTTTSYIAMHMHGAPRTMQLEPLRGLEAVSGISEMFEGTHRKLLKTGFTPDRIWLDPGIGFGKSDQANLMIIEKTPAWSRRWNHVTGLSRKSFIGRVFGIAEPINRDAVSHALEFACAVQGSRMIRTHNVPGLKRLLTVWLEGIDD